MTFPTKILIYLFDVFLKIERTILEVSILSLFEWNFLGVDSRDLKFCMKTPWTPRKLFCLVNFEF